jgi:hypothetical protein
MQSESFLQSVVHLHPNYNLQIHLYVKFFIAFILSIYKKNISVHQKNSTYAHQPLQNELSKLKVWIVDLACPSIYEQFMMSLIIG